MIEPHQGPEPSPKDNDGKGEDSEDSKVLVEQAERLARSPWSPVQRLLMAGFVVGGLVDIAADGFPRMVGHPSFLPPWARGIAWSVGLASLLVFALSVHRDDDDHVPEPLRSYLRRGRDKTKDRRN